VPRSCPKRPRMSLRNHAGSASPGGRQPAWWVHQSSVVVERRDRRACHAGGRDYSIPPARGDSTGDSTRSHVPHLSHVAQGMVDPNPRESSLRNGRCRTRTSLQIVFFSAPGRHRGRHQAAFLVRITIGSRRAAVVEAARVRRVVLVTAGQSSFATVSRCRSA
jgi:hypothetical protein